MQDGEVELYDSTGARILHTRIENKNTINIDPSTLPKGTYLIKVFSSQGWSVYKTIKD
ncbi:MAG: T9SS type A sorting domain-containing protein [Bacteroidota bacterium]